MSYRVILVRSAEREFHSLTADARERITAALRRLGQEPRPRGVRRLSQEHGWRVRVGDYRILYTVDDGGGLVTVYAIGHRREVYRR